MPALNFRTKLVLAMSLTVLLMSATTLYVSQGRVEAAYQAQFEEQFRLHLTIFSERRMQKRGEVARRCQRVAESVRLISALEEALIEDDPELVNKSPTDKGWFMKIRMSDASELDGMMDEAAYKDFAASRG